MLGPRYGHSHMTRESVKARIKDKMIGAKNKKKLARQ